MCKNTVKKWLDNELFTLKNVRNEIDRMNFPENKRKRATYMEQLFNCRAEGRTPIWIDETNFNLYCKRRAGRSKIGTRASVLLPASKGANLHCIGAMATGQIVRFTTKRGAFKSGDCVEWFQSLIEDCQTAGITDPTFIIDNAPAHVRIDQLIEEHPHVKLLRLAPYSYLLNPIELLWSVYKSHVKRMLRDRMPEIRNFASLPGLSVTEQKMRELEEIANRAITNVTPAMLLGFTNRVERYYPMATRQEDLKEFP